MKYYAIQYRHMYIQTDLLLTHVRRTKALTSWPGVKGGKVVKVVQPHRESG